MSNSLVSTLTRAGVYQGPDPSPTWAMLQWFMCRTRRMSKCHEEQSASIEGILGIMQLYTRASALHPHDPSSYQVSDPRSSRLEVRAEAQVYRRTLI